MPYCCRKGRFAPVPQPASSSRGIRSPGGGLLDERRDEPLEAAKPEVPLFGLKRVVRASYRPCELPRILSRKAPNNA